MYRFRATVKINAREVKLLVTDGEGNDCLKAVLPNRPQHPRALLTLLESIALWSGRRVSAVMAVDDCVSPLRDAELFGGGLWPDESVLVRFDLAPDRAPRRIRGPGDFRHVYLAHRRGGRS